MWPRLRGSEPWRPELGSTALPPPGARPPSGLPEAVLACAPSLPRSPVPPGCPLPRPCPGCRPPLPLHPPRCAPGSGPMSCCAGCHFCACWSRGSCWWEGEGVQGDRRHCSNMPVGQGPCDDCAAVQGIPQSSAACPSRVPQAGWPPPGQPPGPQTCRPGRVLTTCLSLCGLGGGRAVS